MGEGGKKIDIRSVSLLRVVMSDLLLFSLLETIFLHLASRLKVLLFLFLCAVPL